MTLISCKGNLRIMCPKCFDNKNMVIETLEPHEENDKDDDYEEAKHVKDEVWI